MKQSSIDWMVEQIEKSSKEGDIDFLLWNLKQNLLVEAKAMHRGEVEYANYNGQSLHAKYTTDRMMRENAEYYYEKTFNTKEK